MRLSLEKKNNIIIINGADSIGARSLIIINGADSIGSSAPSVLGP